eukprot:CAMPEP_0185844514 /NCGR_PEP_ID=MMETSP1354-20130828/646_1 /TAXON_ID=708628 /ORGANISM="Erythrolobus madagascarensis, Strain CCMP3276" /LENGTH=498 /DNA_ID=CAMNT_0028544187 /DNA_START=17 /DNA_END=1515 /DNA_ORIENTATION=+
MAAFVGAAAVGRAAGAQQAAAVSSQRTRAASSVRMGVVDRLDSSERFAFEEAKQVYTFSRYVLGPFRSLEAKPTDGVEEKDALVAAILRQVFGNAYIMEEEREEFAVAESQFRLGELSVKDFCRALAKTSTYQTRFLEGAVQYRFIELCFKHFLGRAPDNHEEVAVHMRTYQQQGYDAEIDSYFDSGEYDNVFGDDTVPFLRFRGVYTPCDSFNRQCALQGGWANSDKAMGGAALSGYNGSDGRQMSTLISTWAADVPVEYTKVAANTPLKATDPNWYACPNPAVAPEPAFVSESEVSALRARAAQLQAAYDAATAARAGTALGGGGSTDPADMWRAAAKELSGMYGFAPTGTSYYYGYELTSDNSPVTGQKGTDWNRTRARMDTDEVSRIEKDLEQTKAELRVLESALAKSTPMSKKPKFAGLEAAKLTVTTEEKAERPRIAAVARPAAPKPAAAPEKKAGGDFSPEPAQPAQPSVWEQIVVFRVAIRASLLIVLTS